jgi:hypothetical protein
MPQTFGQLGSGFPLVDVRCIKEHRHRFRRDMFQELDQANSYYSMSGRWPDVGWLLMDRVRYDQINPYATDLQLTIEDFVNPPLVLNNLTVVQARCVTKGISADPNAIYLIQVTNTEGVLYNPWFQFPVNAQYNVRAPAYDGQYYSGSLNSGVPWTWDTMVGNLWAQAPTLLGPYPHLPITPTSTPENFIFVGIPLWEAISRIMDYLGLAISGGYPTYSIVVPGAPDTAYTALDAKYAKYLEDSMEYLDTGSGRVPSTVVVYFHKRYQYYGTEETVRNDSYQWQNTPLYQVTVPAPALFADAAGTAYLWADFTVRYDMNGNPLTADVATAATIAQERVNQFFDTIYRGTQGFLRHVYSGVLPFTTGSLVDGVRWFNTGMIGDSDDAYAGWRTEVIRGYIWDAATFQLTLKGLTGPT